MVACLLKPGAHPEVPSDEDRRDEDLDHGVGAIRA